MIAQLFIALMAGVAVFAVAQLFIEWAWDTVEAVVRGWGLVDSE